MDRPDSQAVLDAAHLETTEEAYFVARQATYQEQDPEGIGDAPVLPVNPAGSLADAVDRLRRIAYHRRRIAEIRQQADELIAPLRAQIDQIEAWAADQTRGPEQRIWFHEQALVAFYRLNPPRDSKTLKLPGGRISSREQQPEWIYADPKLIIGSLQPQDEIGIVDTAVRMAWDQLDLPAEALLETFVERVTEALTAIRHPAVTLKWDLNKPRLKESVEMRPDGQVADKESGEIVAGVRVEPRPPAYKVEVE